MTVNPNAKHFLNLHDAAIAQLRDVALRMFENGADGLLRIISELQAMQNLAQASDLPVLVECLSDISGSLQSGVDDPSFLRELATLSDSWAAVIYELSNYFVFMADDDEQNLRQHVLYRLTQLVKVRATFPPATIAPVNDALKSGETAPSTPTESMLDSHYLICLIGSQQYALPVHQVREILERRVEKPLPGPVVDVSHILHANDGTAPQNRRKKSCLVVCEVDHRTFCFNVDDVKQVASIDEFQDQIKPLHPVDHTQKALSHIAHFQDKSVLFVQMREVMPT